MGQKKLFMEYWLLVFQNMEVQIVSKSLEI